MKKMFFCESCGSYTLQPSHCGVQTISAHPAPYNPNDRFAALRRSRRFGIGI